jgi:hypothetical protein
VEKKCKDIMEELATAKAKEEISEAQPLEKKDDGVTFGLVHTLSGNHFGQASLRREQHEQLESSHIEK